MGGIVFEHLSWSLRILLMVGRLFDQLNFWGFVTELFSQSFFDLFETETAFPKDLYRLVKYFKDCALYSKFAFSSFYNPYVIFVKIIKNMNRLCRTHMTEEVGTRSPNWQLALFQQFSEIWMVWTSDADESCRSSHNHWKYI